MGVGSYFAKFIKKNQLNTFIEIEIIVGLIGGLSSVLLFILFEKVYYSYEMGMRKPNPSIYSSILNKHDLSPKRTLFVDDKKANTDAAASLGINIWNLKVGEEDVVDLFNQKHLPL